MQNGEVIYAGDKFVKRSLIEKSDIAIKPAGNLIDARYKFLSPDGEDPMLEYWDSDTTEEDSWLNYEQKQNIINSSLKVVLSITDGLSFFNHEAAAEEVFSFCVQLHKNGATEHEMGHAAYEYLVEHSFTDVMRYIADIAELDKKKYKVRKIANVSIASALHKNQLTSLVVDY